MVVSTSLVVQPAAAKLTMSVKAAVRAVERRKLFMAQSSRLRGSSLIRQSSLDLQITFLARGCKRRRCYGSPSGPQAQLSRSEGKTVSAGYLLALILWRV